MAWWSCCRSTSSRSGSAATIRRRLRIPEHFYGFVGLAVVWQLAFLLIARDVVRYRPLMPIAVAEKAAFAIPTFVLFTQGRVAAATTAVAGIDAVLGLLFLAAYLATRPDAPVL